MFQALRKHITPATVLAFVALVFAVTGGAFAATGSGGGAGAKASASVTPPAVAAKAKAKPKTKAGPRGPAGPAGKNGTNGTNGAPGATGPAGPTGPTGAAGGPGTAGAAGGAGANGKSVTVAEEKAGGANCKGQGGASLEQEGSGKKIYACNGQTGFTATLPSGQTETGAWEATSVGFGSVNIATLMISFPIPLAQSIPFAAVHVVTVKEVGESTIPTGCSGSAAEPKAAAGNLCVFEGSFSEGGEHLTGTTLPVESPAGTDNETGTTGARLRMGVEAEKASNYGTWAVTAE